MFQLKTMAILAVMVFAQAESSDAQFVSRGPQVNVDTNHGGTYEVLAGSTNVVVQQVFITNNTKWPVRLRSMAFNVNLEGDIISKLFNFRAYQITTQLETFNNPDANIEGNLSSHSGIVWFAFKPESQVLIKPGESITLDVLCSVSPNTAANSVITSTLNTRSLWFGRPLRVMPRRAQLPGLIVNIIRNGTLYLSESVHHDGGIISGNKVIGSAIRFTVRAPDEDVSIEGLPIEIGKLNNGGPDQIKKIRIEAVISKQVTEAVPVSSDNFPGDEVPFYPSRPLVELNQPVNIAKGRYEVFEVSFETSDVNQEIGSTGESGQGFYLKVSGDKFKARGLQSGAVLKSPKIFFSEEFYVFKTFPLVSILPPSNTQLSCSPELNKHLLSVDFSNITSGTELGVSRVSFLVATQNVVLHRGYLYNYRGQLIASTTPDENGIVTFDLPAIEVRVLGRSERMQFRGDVEVLSCAPENPAASMTIRFLTDSAWPNPSPTTHEVAAQTSNFLWTDFTWSSIMGAADPDVYTLPQWSNSYFVNAQTWPVVLAR